ncbi:hypothetical protein Acr_04g0006910 [Actinidia rufa]|uniref:Uncharacterized protein n=1 Tax=Actinidia rufa TaxID=165716 RepID=A0A7J0EHI8_9ERIC|nr:hypothetical protein Acr_04g0006910 [Actinidia rufa]
MRQPMQNILLELLPSQVQTCQIILLNWASLSLPASALPSPLPPAPSIALAPETRPISSLCTSTPDVNAVVPPIRSKACAICGPSQLLESGPAAVSSSQSLQTPHDDVEVWKNLGRMFQVVGITVTIRSKLAGMVAKLQIQITKGNRLGCYPFFCDIADLESEEQAEHMIGLEIEGNLIEVTERAWPDKIAAVKKNLVSSTVKGEGGISSEFNWNGKSWAVKGWVLEEKVPVVKNWRKFEDMTMSVGRGGNERDVRNGQNGQWKYNRGSGGFNGRRIQKQRESNLVWVRKGDTSDVDVARVRSLGKDCHCSCS